MEQLAEKYAKLKGTTVLASRINIDGTITFVLESGPKLTMSTRQLEEAIAKLTHSAPSAVPAASTDKSEKPKKGKAK